MAGNNPAVIFKCGIIAIQKNFDAYPALKAKFKLYDKAFARSSYSSQDNFAIWVFEPKEAFLRTKEISRLKWSEKMRDKAGSKLIPAAQIFSKLIYELSDVELELAANTLRALQFKETHFDKAYEFNNGETSIVLVSAEKPKGLILAEQRLQAPMNSRKETRKIGHISITLDAQAQKLIWNFL